MRRNRAIAIGLAGWLFADLMLLLMVIGQGDQPQLAASPRRPIPTTTTSTTEAPPPEPEPEPEPDPEPPRVQGLATPVKTRIVIPRTWTLGATDGPSEFAVRDQIGKEMDRLGLIGTPSRIVQVFGLPGTKGLSEQVANGMRRWFPTEMSTADIRPYLGEYSNGSIEIEFFVVQ